LPRHAGGAGGQAARRHPRFVGHDFSATVPALGDSFGSVAVGDHVPTQPLVSPREVHHGKRGICHLSPQLGCVAPS
jgi:(R,R)-butanediol dehydrogenase/meso-butanediol dehydrogenase/diacetyl reductase